MKWLLGFFRRTPLKEVTKVRIEPALEKEKQKEQKPKAKAAYVYDSLGRKAILAKDYAAFSSISALQANIVLAYKEGSAINAQCRFCIIKTIERGSDTEVKLEMVRSSTYILALATGTSSSASKLRIPIGSPNYPESIRECLEFAASYGYSCSAESEARLLSFYSDHFMREGKAIMNGPAGSAGTFIMEFLMPPPEGAKGDRAVSLSMYFYTDLPSERGLISMNKLGCSVIVTLEKVHGVSHDEIPRTVSKHHAAAPKQSPNDPEDPEVEMK